MRDEALLIKVSLSLIVLSLVLGFIPLLLLADSEARTRQHELRVECGVVADRCDNELLTCLYWQARVSHDLEAIRRVHE